MSTDDRFNHFNNTSIHVPIDVSLYIQYFIRTCIFDDIPASKGKYLSSRFFNIRLWFKGQQTVMAFSASLNILYVS